jgi:hypothetical protein
MKELVIQPQAEGKGRAFAATLVSYIEARDFVQRNNDTIRPVFLTLAGTDNELRPFVANLRTGKRADAERRTRFEILKKSGYQVAWQRTAKGSLVTFFAPDLFALDPGMVDPAGVKFCLFPARRWLRPAGDVPVPECVPEERANDVRQLAPLFIAYLDRRTRCPLIPDPRFYVQVFANALDEGLAAWGCEADSYARHGWAHSSYLLHHGLDDIGVMPGVVFRASHAALETFLAQQVAIFFGKEPPEAPEAEDDETDEEDDNAEET